MKKIAIIILNYNGKRDTLDCLETIEKLQITNFLSEPDHALHGNFQTIVVDNNSSDGSVKAIKSKFPKVKIIQNKENLGFSEGNNVGIRYALKQGADYIMLLNNDTLVKKDLLLQLIKVINKNKKIGIVSPKIYFTRGKVIWYAGGKIDWKNIFASHNGVDEIDIGQYYKEKETDFATGCCMLIKKEVFEKIGLFDKKYFLYWEDVDLCERVKKADFKIYFAPKAIIWHKNAGSSASGSALHDYYLTRNRLLFGFKYAFLRTKIALFKESIVKLFNARKWEKRGIIDFYLRRFNKGSYK